MNMHLIKTYPRLWTIEGGVVMVVSDLHGDWEAYARYRDRFLALHAAGEADWLLFTGDLIHREPETGPDHSLDIVLDLLDLRQKYGERIVYLCGNHELPHLYGFVLSRGATVYTPPFERALSGSGRRNEVLALFADLPFYLRTSAGVSLAHAGAFSGFAEAFASLLRWDHLALRAWADAQLDAGDREALRRGYAQINRAPSYEVLAQHNLGAAPGDEQYDDLLRGMMITGRAEWDILWAALFTRCEQEWGEQGYADALDDMLDLFSINMATQRFLVAGHMRVRGGHTVVVGHHLRIASAAHAGPRSAGQYLLFDAARPINTMDDLQRGLGSVFKA